MSRTDCMRVRMSSVSTLVTTSPVLVAGALYSIGSLIFISFHCLGSVYFLSHSTRRRRAGDERTLL